MKVDSPKSCVFCTQLHYIRVACICLELQEQQRGFVEDFNQEARVCFDFKYQVPHHLIQYLHRRCYFTKEKALLPSGFDQPACTLVPITRIVGLSNIQNT